jgi:hypothetical protein
MSDLADEYIEAVKNNNHNKADKVYKEIHNHNQLSVGNEKVYVSKKKVMAAYNSIKGDKSFLTRRLKDPGSHLTILTKRGGKKTLRNTKTRRTRKNGFKGGSNPTCY